MKGNQEQAEPTIRLKEIMKRAGIKSHKSVYHRADNGDFRRTGKRGEFYLDDRAKKAIAAMKESRSKNAGRKKKKD